MQAPRHHPTPSSTAAGGATPACLSSRALSGRVRGLCVLHSLGAKSDSSPAGVEGVWARRMALLSMCSRPSGGFEEFPVLGRVPTDSPLGQVGRAYCTPPLWLATCAGQLLGALSEQRRLGGGLLHASASSVLWAGLWRRAGACLRCWVGVSATHAAVHAHEVTGGVSLSPPACAAAAVWAGKQAPGRTGAGWAADSMSAGAPAPQVRIWAVRSP